MKKVLAIIAIIVLLPIALPLLAYAAWRFRGFKDEEFFYYDADCR